MEILDNGLHVENGTFEYLWLKIRSPQGTVRYRAIALRELTALAIDDKEIEDYNTMGRQAAALRGLYNAGVDFVYSATGIFTPEHVGVVQFYGAAATGSSLDEAVTQVRLRLDAVQGVLANYQQSQTRPPLLRWMEWYLEFITQRARNATVILGHPDPRDARRGVDLEGSTLVDDLAAEQNEMLFRGLAKLRKDFIFQVTADHLDQRQLIRRMVRIDQLVSNIASRRRGAISIGASLSIPIMAALSSQVGHAASRVDSQAHSVQDGVTHGWGRSEGQSYSHTESEAHTVGGSETEGIAHTHSEGVTVTEGGSEAVSRSVTTGRSESHTVTDGVAVTNGSSQNWSASQGQQVSVTESQSQTSGVAVSQGSSQSVSQGGSTQVTQGQAVTDGQNASVNASVNAGVGVAGASVGGSKGTSHLETRSGAVSEGENWSAGASQNQSTTVSGSETSGQAVSAGVSQSQSVGGATQHSVSNVHSESRTTTTNRSETQGVTRTKSWSRSKTVSDAETKSYSRTRSWATTRGKADTWGRSQSQEESWGQSHSEGRTQGLAISRGGVLGLTRGLSSGLVPGLSLNRTWQTEDHVADRLTEILRGVSNLFNEAAHGGGFLSEAVLFTSDDGAAQAVETLVPQAFHGTQAPTPVLTITPQREDECDEVFSHALAFTPSAAPAPGDFLDGALGGQYSTVLTVQQLAAYTAPAIFREGTARVLHAIPKKGLGFYPDMDGEVILGHQYSPETGDLTAAPVRLTKPRFMHLMFAGATGYGKSVGAERLAYEIVRHWDMRTVVLDFGAGWRKLLNAPGIEDRVDIRQLTPHGVRPLRWNPLQISRHITPEVQMAAFVDIFGNVAQLGVKQQKHRFFDAVETVYQRQGVLVNDPKVLSDPQWSRVQDDEAHIAPPGTPLHDLDSETRQQIAVHRSYAVSLQMLYDEVERQHDALPARDQVGRGILEGIMFRLKTLLRGQTAQQFAAGTDAVDMADLGDQDGKRLLILEGGKFLDQFSKAWLLSWAGWLIYQDMVQKREKQLISGDAELTMIFEEANVLFTGLSQRDENAGGVTVSEQYDNMFRDSRKYGVRFVVVTQSPALIPPGVISSCSSLFAGYLADAMDKDLVLSALAKSEKGFVDEPWRRFLSDQSIGMLLGRLPYSFDRGEMRPFLMRPLILQAPEPTDADIEARLGRISL